jgi:hypothetical protein
MKRIVSVIGLALVIGALTAASAMACEVFNGFQVRTPPANANSHAATMDQRACIPINQGTNKANQNSPPIDMPCIR